METVYLLRHYHALGSQLDQKLIGVYGTEAGAKEAQLRMQDKPGFIDCPEGFRIETYVLDKEYWVEGCPP